MNKTLIRRSILIFVLIFAAIAISAPLVQADGGGAHKRRSPRPIKLGTSGGNLDDHTTQFCCSGTLGGVVSDVQGKRYILSNNHVLGISNRARIGSLVSQPGNIDARCAPKQADIVGFMSRIPKIKFGANSNNKIDAAIAEALPGQVSPTGFILDIKNPGQPAVAQIGMRVKKSGRTSGLRRGIIEVLNLTLRVSFPNNCGSNASKVARFRDQIGIADAPGGSPPPFIASGDSGSLLVRDVGNCPSTLGLLFAGDDVGNAAANRIQNVLTALGGMRIVGCNVAAAEAFDPDALTPMHPEVMRAASIQSRHEDSLMKIPGVFGVGIGFAKDGSRELALVVYTERGTLAATSASAVPGRLENLPIRKKITGKFVAF